MGRKILFGILIFIIGWALELLVSVYTLPGRLSPNILLVLVVAIGLICGPMYAVNIGFFWGIFADVFGYVLFGSQALLLALVGYVFGRLSRHLNNEKTATQIVVIFVSSIFYSAGLITLQKIFGGTMRPVNYTDVVIGIAINSLIAPFIFFLIRIWAFKCDIVGKRRTFGG